MAFTKENAAAYGRMGGEMRGKNAARRRSMKEQAELLLDLPPNAQRRSALKKMGIKDEDISNEMALLVAMYKKALDGNVKAAIFVRDVLGEKPDLNINLSDSSKLDDIISQLSGEGLGEDD